MAEPKNEKEWAIYNEMIAEAEEDPVFGRADKQAIEDFKNDPNDQTSWELFKGLWIDLT